MITLKFRKPKAFPCNGTSMWTNTKNVIPKVKQIRLFAPPSLEDAAGYVEVDHSCRWEIYTDSGFEKSISKYVSEFLGAKFNITFTEQGMQENGMASMEYNVTKNTEKLFNKVYNI